MSSTPVRYFDSTMRGLGGIDGTPGSFLSIADKVLMNGYGEVTALNITVLNGVARANFNLDESFREGATIRVLGSDIVALNGDHLVTAATNDYCSWATLAANGTTTTTVTVKGAPLGWSAVATAVNKRTYKSNAPTATGHIIRFVDTTAQYLSVHAYESMSNIDTGVNKQPAIVTYSEWPKSQSANTVKRNWFILGDDKGFFFGINITNTLSENSLSEVNYPFAVYWIGEGISEDITKTNLFIVTSENQTNHAGISVYVYSTVAFINTTDTVISTTSTPHCAARDYLDIALSPMIKIKSEVGEGQSGYQTVSNYPPFPNPGNNRIFLSRMTIMENLTKSRRGILPGLYSLNHSSIGNLCSGSVIPSPAGFENKKLMCILGSGNHTSQVSAAHIFDMTGPWR